MILSQSLKAELLDR